MSGLESGDSWPSFWLDWKKSKAKKNGQNESKGSTEEFYYNVESVVEKKYISDYQTSL